MRVTIVPRWLRHVISVPIQFPKTMNVNLKVWFWLQKPNQQSNLCQTQILLWSWRLKWCHNTRFSDCWYRGWWHYASQPSHIARVIEISMAWDKPTKHFAMLCGKGLTREWILFWYIDYAFLCATLEAANPIEWVSQNYIVQMTAHIYVTRPKGVNSEGIHNIYI